MVAEQRLSPGRPLSRVVDALKRQGGPVSAIWIGLAALLLLVWLQVALHIRNDEKRELAGALRDLSNITRVSQEHADSTLHSADQVLRFVRERYLALGDGLDLPSMDRIGLIDGEHFPQIGIIDPRGRYIISSRSQSTGIDLSDREHFRVHLPAGKSDTLFISKPVLGRATGKRSIQLTRRITLPDGAFGGVVVLSVDPDYFANFYAELQLGPGGVAALTGLDGVVRAQRAGNPTDLASRQPASWLAERLGVDAAVGSYTARSPADGVERLVHFRRLAGYPLAVAASQALDDVLAPHRAMRRLLVEQAALLSAAAAVIALLLARYLRRSRSEVAARQQAMVQVGERNESLAALMSLSPDGVVGFDRAGTVRYINPACRKLLGAEAFELIGMGEQDFSRWLASRCQPEARFAEGEFDEQRIVLGASRRSLLVTSKRGHEGGLSRLLHVRDVSQADATDTASTDLLGMAAYELRAPMASIYGYSEVLATHAVSAGEYVEFTQIIHQQAGYAARILDDLQTLARKAGSGQQELALSQVDLGQLVSDAIRSHRLPAGRSQPHFEPGESPLPVRADAARLRQAFLNVLANAYTFSQDDSPVQVGFAARRSGGQQQIGLRVIDSGIGMSPDQVRQVCDHFYRADRYAERAGSGLGMSVVKATLSLHGGEVAIDSTLGQGTSVTLWLPVDPSLTHSITEAAQCPAS